MENDDAITRRTLLRTAAATGGGAVLTNLMLTNLMMRNTLMAEEQTPVKTYKNSDFYDADGKFQVEKAKEAYFDMMRRFHYPIPESLRKGMWVLEFGLNDFVNVGMAGIFWYNDQKNGYFGHEIFLLPNQMIAEHAHEKTEKGKAKMEAWHVRHGMIHTFGEGEPTEPCPVKTPASQKDFITVKHVTILKEGELAALQRETAKHFMLSGSEGAIVTEYGTFHDNDGLRFTNPGVKLTL